MSAIRATHWSPFAVLSSGAASVRARIGDELGLHRDRGSVTIAIPAGSLARQIVVEAAGLTTVYEGEFFGPTSLTVTGPLDHRSRRPARILRINVRLESAAQLPSR